MYIKHKHSDVLSFEVVEAGDDLLVDTRLNVGPWGSYRLAGVIYYGDYHFVSRVITREGKVYTHDGMDGVHKCPTKREFERIAGSRARPHAEISRGAAGARVREGLMVHGYHNGCLFLMCCKVELARDNNGYWAVHHIHPGTDFTSLRRATHVLVSSEEETLVPGILSPQFVPLDNYPMHAVEQIYMLHVDGDAYRIITRQQPPHRPHIEQWHHTSNNGSGHTSPESEGEISTGDSEESSPESEGESSIVNSDGFQRSDSNGSQRSD
ncbi:hypothetical protein DFP72DRAFT_850137 [Ephemerocybe angulata]|uniref:Uncharacterized protein n=1 Tax=Ephemerocybe angulata TaxID=980116 RepID=A0A8H6HSF9_9AGAR|nr:hypothetical protein DFP72DRAFT_850137 [Tulosesus angulatus]